MNSSGGCKVSDNINGIAVLETDKQGGQNLLSDIGDIWYGSQHPVHARAHTSENYVHLPSFCQLSFEQGKLAIPEMRSDLCHLGNHEVEARLLVQRLELFLRPAFGRFYWVLVEVAPSRLDRFGGDVVNLCGRKQLQRAGHKSFAARGCLLLDKQGSRGEFGGGDQQHQGSRVFSSEVLVIVLRP